MEVSIRALLLQPHTSGRILPDRSLALDGGEKTGVEIAEESENDYRLIAEDLEVTLDLLETRPEESSPVENVHYTMIRFQHKGLFRGLVPLFRESLHGDLSRDGFSVEN